MKEKEIIKNIKEEFHHFESSWQKEEMWSAIVSLSYIYNCITKENKSSQIGNLWKDKIFKPELTEEAYSYIKNSYIEIYNQMGKILSVGDRFNDDEFLLLISYHTSLCLVLEYLNARSLECPIVDLKGIEKEIIEFGRMKKNKRDFNSAISQMRKNRKIPINIIWYRL